MGQYDPKTPSRFNTVNIILVLTLLVGGYAAAFYVPYWWPVFRLKSVMKGIGNDAYRKFDDDELRRTLVKRARALDTSFKSEDFTLYRDLEGIDGVDIDTVAGKRGNSFTITFEKSYKAKWPLLNKHTDLSFRRMVHTDLAVIKY